MLGGHIVAGAMLGGLPLGRLGPMVFIVPTALGGLCIYLYCLRFANLEWKLFLVYCAAVFAGSLRSPLIEGPKPAWDLLVSVYSARYWFFPMLAFVWSVVWCALYARGRLFKTAGTCIFLSMSIGIVRDWTYGSFPDKHFAASVQRMHEAKPGDLVIIPIVPEGWQVELVKKSP
jgi:hypothetical protein